MEIELNIPETEITGKDISVETGNINIAVSEDTKDLDITYNRKEYSIIGDGIFISSVLDDVPEWLGDLIDSTFEAAILSRDQNLINRMEAILTAMDYVPKNQYTEQINQIVDEDGIINSRIATLNSNLTDAINSTNATVAEINLTYASKDEAAAIATNALTASLSGSGEIGSAIINLQSAFVGLESETELTIGSIESVVETLQIQVDGKVESWFTISINDPKDMWIDQFTRDEHDKDMWYQIDTKSSYWYSGGNNTWNPIEDATAIQALEDAVTAQSTADGKITTYYIPTLLSAQSMSSLWTATEKLNNTGDLVIIWDDTVDNNTTWRWNGSSWVDIRDKKLISVASDVTNLETELTNGTNTWASADSTLENSLLTEITNEGTRVESKFSYDSLLNINGTTYSSGFGLASNLTDASIPVGDSEFWVNANKFRVYDEISGKQTLISGGKINTELIEIKSEENGYLFTIDKDGIKIVKDGVLRLLIGKIS